MGSLFSGRTSVQTETVRWSFQCLSTEGGLDYHWESCLKGYDQQNKVGTKASKTSFTRPTFGYKQTINVASCFFPIFLSLYCFPCPSHLPLPHCQHHHLHNSSGPTVPGGTHVLKECLGQNFQVSILLSHLLASPAYSSDVLMQPYLSSWDELVK